MLPEFDAEKVWYNLLDTVSDTADQVTVFMAVPTIYAKLLEHYDAKSGNSITYQRFVKDVCTSKIRWASRHLFGHHCSMFYGAVLY